MCAREVGCDVDLHPGPLQPYARERQRDADVEVARKRRRGLSRASVVFVDDFNDGLSMMAAGTADFMLQVAVHPACADIVATAHFQYGIHIVDTFISASKPLGILTRAEVETPCSLGLQPATREYADLSGWRLRGAVRFEFPAGTRLAPDAALIVCANRDAFERAKLRVGGWSLVPSVLASSAG